LTGLTGHPSSAAGEPAPVRLLVVNGNTSELATRRIGAYALAVAPPRCEIETVRPERGPEGVDTALDATLAAVEVARTIAARWPGFDACVIACGVDPGLAASRQACPRPVVGIAEAGLLCAAPAGEAFVVPVLSRGQVGAMRSLVGSYGMAGKLAALPSIETTAARHFADPAAVFPALRDACAEALDRHGGDTVVLTGAAMAGLEERLTQALGVPVICGLAAGVALAAALARLPGAWSRTRPDPRKPGTIRGYEDLRQLYETVIQA
jgi:allantoin racemase